MLALKLRAPEPEPAESVACDEYWIGHVEPCGDDWTFSVIGPDEDTETFVYGSQHAAEFARARMFRTLCPAVAVTTLCG
jgi:hypothetical protein